MKVWLFFISLVISALKKRDSGRQPKEVSNRYQITNGQEHDIKKRIIRRQLDFGKTIDSFKSSKEIDLDKFNDLSPIINKFIPADSNLELINDEANISEAKHYFYMAGVSYFNSGDLKNIKCEKFQNTLRVLSDFHINLPKLRAVILEDKTKNELIISFRGADGSEQVMELASFEDIKFNEQGDQKIHKKSMEFLNKILPGINNKLKTIEKNSYSRLVLVGHSMGGSLALLASFEIHKQLIWDYSKIAVFTYSQPKVGNLKFIEYVNSLPMKILRVIDSRDVVPKHPFIGGWAHTKRVIELNEKTNVRSVPNGIRLKQCIAINSNKRISVHNLLWGVNVGRNKCIV